MNHLLMRAPANSAIAAVSAERSSLNKPEFKAVC